MSIFIRKDGLAEFTKSIDSIPVVAVCLSALLMFTASATAQSSPVTPSKATDESAYRLTTNVRRVFVDVVVTDRKGHPVKGFGRDDFQVFEDGTLQPLRGFDAHEPVKPEVVRPEPHLDLPPNTFANLVHAPEDEPVTVILYDVLNTPLASLPYAHDAMVRFIKDQKSNKRIAIFVLNDQLRMLQGFTDDETRLLAAINSKSVASPNSRYLSLNTDASAANDAVTADLPAGATNVLSELKSLEASEATILQQQRLEITVNAFAQVARFVSALPGRKNLIWLSGSFPTGALPNSDPTVGGNANEFGDTYSLGNEVKEAEDLLNLNHVAVYPVDVRGLQVNPAFNAASNAKGSPTGKSISAFQDTQSAEHGTMDDVADSTGGRAFYNTNGLKQAMESAIDDGSTYYTLTYAPSNTKIDGTLRKIRVTLRASGYELSYRRSYFADSVGGPAPGSTAAASGAQDRDMFVDAAMAHGSPISSELFFEASVLPVGAVMTAAPQEMKSLSEFLATKKVRGLKAPSPPDPVMVQHYEVSYAILGRQLQLPPEGNGYATDMTFALAAFQPDGALVNGLELQVKNTIPPEKYQKIKTQGYHASLVFVVPVGAASLRIAVRDGIGHRMGTIEVPLPISAPKNQTPSGETKQ